jgi:hypothetical protein
MTAPKKKPAPAPKNRNRNKYPSWGIRIPTIYREIIAELAAESRRSMTEEAKIAFEEYFTRKGKWPRVK